MFGSEHNGFRVHTDGAFRKHQNWMFEPVQAINIQNDLYILNHIKYYSSELSLLKKC